jgi:signal transduction histidine kinase
MMEEWQRLLKQLGAELTLRERELELLHKIDVYLLDPPESAGIQSAEDIFKFIVQETAKLLHANHTTILLRRSTFLEPMYSNLSSVINQKVPISQSLTGLSLERDKTVNVADLSSSPLQSRYTPLRGYTGPAMRSLLATPIRIRGVAVGVLNAESTRANAFKPVHERIAKAVAAQTAIALQQTQTLASTALFADLDRLMLATSDSVQVVQESEHVIQTALKTVMAELDRLEHVEHTGAQIMFDSGQGELQIVHSTNPEDIGLTVLIDNSICGRAVRERKTIIVDDVGTDPEYQRMLSASIQSEIAVPILIGGGDVVIGVLNVESEEKNAFSDFYQLVLENFAEKVRTLLALAKLRSDVTEALELRNADDVLAAIGDQTSHMIHNLNNTVGAMRLRVLELQDAQQNGGPADEFLRASLKALLDLANRTLKMPDEITVLTAKDRRKVDVNACVEGAIKKVDLPGSVKLVRQLTDGIPPLPLYNFNIVVENLLRNSVDAMPEGGTLTVSTAQVLDPARLTGYLQVVIRDTGSGIPPDIEKKIFDLNFTTKKGKGKGLGFGLWWVRNFVRRARGDITVRTPQNGRGAEFVIKIPIDRPDSRVPAEAN